MKPKLKPDVYWVPQDDTLAFIHPGSPLTIRGRSALPLMDRLAPYLDGTVDLDDLVGGLPEAKRDMVMTLVTALSEAGLVKDAQDDEPHPLTAAELERYAAEIEYIDHHLSSAGRRFHTFRTTRITCLGAGMSLNALVHACLRAGVADLTVLVAEDCPTDTELLDRFVAENQKTDTLQRVRREPFAGSPSGLRDAVIAADLVLHVSDRPVPARARDLDRLCREFGRPLIQGIVVDDEAWTGPVAGAAGAGWESAWLRMRSNRPRSAAEPEPFPAEPVAESQFLAGPTASIVGNRVGFMAFQYVTGVSAASDTVSLVDLETLDTTEYRFLPHPLAREVATETEAEAAQRFSEFLEWPAPDPASFSRAAAELFDPRLGPMRSLDESDLPQLPLHLAEVSVADPFGWLDTSDGHPTAVGLGDSFGAARHHAALRAFELYATLAVDPRRLLRGPDRVFARDLVADAWTTIDAELAYPVLGKPGPAETFTRPVGLAAALTGDEALRLGLLDHCAWLAADAVDAATDTVADAVADAVVDAVADAVADAAVDAAADAVADAVDSAREQFPRLPLDAIELDGTAALYRDAARTALPGLCGYDLTALSGVPATAWCDGESTLCYTAGSDLTEAVTAGLVQALLHYQAPGLASPAASPAVPPLPERLRGPSGPASPMTSTVTSTVRVSGWRDLVAILAAAGHRVYAVPVGHDPVVTAVLPTVVQVVVA